MFSHYDEFDESYRRRLACLLEMLQGNDPLLLEAAQLIEAGLIAREHPSMQLRVAKSA